MIAVAVCYFIAFLLELYQFIRRNHRRNHWGIFPAAFGFILHTIFVYKHHIVAAHPIGGAAMCFLASAWGLVLIYFLWTYYHPYIPFGVIVLPLALLLTGSGVWSASLLEPNGLSLRTWLKMLHVVSAAGFVIALLTGSICWTLHSHVVYLLRKKRPLAYPIRLPSLEWSLSAFRISMLVALCCISLCLLTMLVVFFLQCYVSSV